MGHSLWADAEPTHIRQNEGPDGGAQRNGFAGTQDGHGSAAVFDLSYHRAAILLDASAEIRPGLERQVVG
jgi:hypothetical protein